jgi:hypothetical protein
LKTRKENTYVLLFFAIVSLLMVGPHLFPLTKVSTSIYDPADANIFLWNFWWTNKALSELRNPYWTDFLFHPDGTSLALYGYPIIYSALSIPVQFCLPGLKGLALAFNFIVFLSFVLSGWGAYLLVRHLTQSKPGALIAGLIFSFMPFHFLNIARLNLLAIECLPFYILSLLKLHEKVNVGRALAVSGWLAFAFYSCLEYALYLVFFSALWLSYELIFRSHRLQWRFIAYLALAAVVFTLLASPLLYQQLAAARVGGSMIEQSIDETVHWSPAVLSLITPSRLNPVYGDIFASAGEYADGRTWGMRSESSLGIITLCLAIAATILAKRQKKHVFWALAAFVFITLSLGPYLRLTGTRLTRIPMPYLFLYKLVPPLRAGRDPTRFVPLVVLFLAILAAFGVSYLLHRFDRKKVRVLLMCLFVLFVLFENLIKWPRSQIPEPHPFYKKLAKVPGEFAIIDLNPRLTTLLAQTIHGKKITYVPVVVPRSPSIFKQLGIERAFRNPQEITDLDTKDRRQWFSKYKEVRRRLKIRYVIIPAEKASDEQIQIAEELGATITEENGLVICEFQGDVP